MKAKIELTPNSRPNNLEKDPVEAAFDRNDWLKPNEFGNYLKEELMRLNEEIQHSNFTSFDRLTEEIQNELMSEWDDDMQLRYISREATMSQEEFYAQLDHIAKGTFIEK